MTIDESHDLIVEPGPYPPDEHPAAFADCRHGCSNLQTPCAALYRVDGWEMDDEPLPWAQLPDEAVVGAVRCSICRTVVQYAEHEYDDWHGQAVRRLVWVETYRHPDHPAVQLCEDCVCSVEAGAFQ